MCSCCVYYQTLISSFHTQSQPGYWPNSYSPVIGMMFYLSSNTRPDTPFVVHQCDRFTHSTKASHDTAVKRIWPYLHSTKYKGLLFNPSNKLVVGFYADSYLKELWGQKNTLDPICDRIRTGFVVKFSNFLYCGCQNYRQRLLSLLYIIDGNYPFYITTK